METNNTNSPKPEDKPAETVQAAPSDALSRTPEELEQESAEQEKTDAAAGVPAADTKPEKKTSGIKKFFKKVNLYFLIFLLLVVVGGAVTVVNYLNSKKQPPAPTIASQDLNNEALKKLANSDVSLGDASHTLNVQGNIVVAGQALIRGNLDVAGNIRTGGTVQGNGLTISGASNLGASQINSLQIATTLAVQGNTTLRDLSVAGKSTFNSPITASQITVTNLIMSGNASLQIPNHISFPGETPSRSINSGTLGSGGSASVNGSDTSGTVNINTGNNTHTGCFVDITFRVKFPSMPRVIVSPFGEGAGLTSYYVNKSTTGFSICAAETPPANRSFGFDYFVSY